MHRDATPLVAFRIVRHEFHTLGRMFADDEKFRQAWARWGPHRASLEQQTASNPESLGVVPLKFMVNGAGDLSHLTSVHLYRSNVMFQSRQVKELAITNMNALLTYWKYLQWLPAEDHGR